MAKNKTEQQRDDSVARSVLAIPVGHTAALVTMRFGPRGPWSVLTDMPSNGRELIGPPPGQLALAGWGC